MPLYEYKCAECEYIFSEIKSISERKIPESLPCPSCKTEGKIQQVISSVPMADAVRLGRKKPDEGFRDVMREIKKKTPGAIFDVV